MTTRSLPRIAWAQWTLSVVLSFGSLVLAVLNRYTAPELVAELIGPLAAVSFGFVGALVAARQPRNPIGWIFGLVGLTQGLVSVAYNYALYVLVTSSGALPFGPLMSWIGQLIWFPGLCVVLTYGLLLFPDGRLPSPRWRFVGWACVLPLGLFVVAAALAWPERGRAILFDTGAGQAGKLAFWVDALLFPSLLLCGLACVTGLFVRFRRSRGVERQQLKWFTFAAAATLAMLWLSELLSLGLLSILLFLPFVPSIPAAVAIAILQHRLYDIDVIIRRTLIYGVLSATLALLYLGSVVVLQQAVRTLTGQSSDLAVVASTLLIAALFQPLRRRVQSMIDRRFYRRNYDAAATVAAFGARLRDEVALNRLSDDLVTVINDALQPTHASLWLRKTGGGE